MLIPYESSPGWICNQSAKDAEDDMNQHQRETDSPSAHELTENELSAIQGGNIFDDLFGRLPTGPTPISKVPLSPRARRRLVGAIISLF